jgi:hypothetical protein
LASGINAIAAKRNTIRSSNPIKFKTKAIGAKIRRK